MKKNVTLVQDIKKFCEAIDIDDQVDFVRAYEKIGDSALYGGKHCGSDAEHEGARMIADKLKEIGLPHVELVPCKTSRYQFNDAAIEIAGEGEIIKPYGYVSPGTPEEGMTLELVDAGKASKEDFKEISAKGKAVLLAAMGTLEGANLSGQIEQAIKQGAAAIVIYAQEDVLNDETIRVQPPNILSPVPIVGICMKDAAFLQRKAAAGSCKIQLTVDAEFIPNGGTTYNVVGEIPGNISDERIIYTAHLDHYFRCLQDNMSTCSTLIGIAKAMLDSGYQPNRTIAFVFHGSHETGGMDTRYPYIFGSYQLTHESRPEWTGKAIANINFEYTALRMKKLQATAYLGANRIPISYFSYSPELIGGGFDTKEQYAPQTEYYMLSWSDCISYHTAGIPTLCNDPISEQYYEGTGPYVGRDHSNFDNWDVFDVKILEDTGRFYGGMGLYLDSMPYLALDYTEQASRIRAEVDAKTLDSFAIPHEAYFAAASRLEKAAAAANKWIEEKNAAYIEALAGGLDEAGKKQCFDEARKVNEKMLAAYQTIADGLDKINAQDFICLATVKYMQNARLLLDAKAQLAAGDAEKAFETLAAVDLAASSYYFDEEIVEHMRKQICAPEFADRRTWAAGRELAVFTYYDLVQAFVSEQEAGGAFGETLKLIEEAIETECALIPQAMANEQACMEKVIQLLESIGC